MNCPKCGELTQVLDSRGAVRRRECVNGHRFRTVEEWKQNLPPKPKPAEAGQTKPKE